jgi:hypothetical protein
MNINEIEERKKKKTKNGESPLPLLYVLDRVTKKYKNIKKTTSFFFFFQMKKNQTP